MDSISKLQIQNKAVYISLYINGFIFFSPSTMSKIVEQNKLSNFTTFLEGKIQISKPKECC